MGDHIKRDDELTEEELQEHSGGRRTAKTNEPLREATPPEPPLTTQAVGEEEDEGDKIRYVL